MFYCWCFSTVCERKREMIVSVVLVCVFQHRLCAAVRYDEPIQSIQYMLSSLGLDNYLFYLPD